MLKTHLPLRNRKIKTLRRNNYIRNSTSTTILQRICYREFYRELAAILNMEVVGLILFPIEGIYCCCTDHQRKHFKYMVCHPKNAVIDDKQTIIPGFKGFFVVWRSLIVYRYLFSIIHIENCWRVDFPIIPYSEFINMIEQIAHAIRAIAS